MICITRLKSLGNASVSVVQSRFIGMDFYVHIIISALLGIGSALFVKRKIEWREITLILVAGIACLGAGAFFPWSYASMVIPGAGISVRPSPFFLGVYGLVFGAFLSVLKSLRHT